MAVIIDEIEHTAPAAPDRLGGGAGAGDTDQPAGARQLAQILAVLRRDDQRDLGRRARLWAD